ncbi:MAG: protein translocase subunit SecD, partial [Candidatus Altiarchaeota archaeon]|nr:protein translocase subunit SecD [Candidatus Altiarchaeota archaeon]
DLPAVAGIIAAVGTGVDHQIIITDESISRRHGEQKKKLVSLVERIKRAFFIIFVSAATTIAVMIPVFLIQSLKGFALTTAVGVFIGITITRPAYAKIIEGILKR